jgi:antitoxin (DNA-binding transcriptional repressor) of toxin-antitoxin stability system
MLYEIDITDAPGRFAELIQTIDAGYGVLIRRDGEVIARLAPESLFHERQDEPEDTMTPEERQAKETFEMFQHDIEDSF